MPSTILVAGGAGQVARALAEAALPSSLHLRALGRPDLDILKTASIEAAFDRVKPDLVINAAAYTAVDQAETDIDAAEALNAHAAAALASAAARHSIPIFHLSTDYVFDGTNDLPYTEEDPVAPLSAYGRSKLHGERAAAAANCDSLILRTAWVYSPFGKNFVETMLRLAKQREELGVVRDQIGNPTSAHDIADALVVIAAAILAGKVPIIPGTYHLAGTGETSWAGFAEAIFRESAALGGPSARVRPIPASDYSTLVARPANSRLDCTKIKNTYGIVMPNWQDSMRACIRRLLKTGT